MSRKSFIQSGKPLATFTRELMQTFSGSGIVITQKMSENIYNKTLKDPEKMKDILIKELITYPQNIQKLATVNIFNPEETRSITDPEPDDYLDYGGLAKYIQENDL